AAMHDAVGPLGEVLQELEIAVRQIDAARCIPRLQLGEVDGDVVERQEIYIGTRAPEDGVNPREQFLEIYRLGDVGVGAELQAADLVLLLSFRRQENDRGSRTRAPAGAQLETALAGQVDVEQHQVGREFAQRAGRQVAVRDRAHLESLERQVVVQ